MSPTVHPSPSRHETRCPIPGWNPTPNRDPRSTPYDQPKTSPVIKVRSQSGVYPSEGRCVLSPVWRKRVAHQSTKDAVCQAVCQASKTGWQDHCWQRSAPKNCTTCARRAHVRRRVRFADSNNPGRTGRMSRSLATPNNTPLIGAHTVRSEWDAAVDGRPATEPESFRSGRRRMDGPGRLSTRDPGAPGITDELWLSISPAWGEWLALGVYLVSARQRLG